MTNESRARKVQVLAHVSDWVAGPNSIDEFGYATVSWPFPKNRQFATIDVESGKVTRFVRQSGSVTEEVYPLGDLAMIDRRINYLANQHRKEMSESKTFLTRIKHQRGYHGTLTDS